MAGCADPIILDGVQGSYRERAVASLQAVRSHLTGKDASTEVVNAISFAGTCHGKWLWSGVGADR